MGRPTTTSISSKLKTDHSNVSCLANKQKNKIDNAAGSIQTIQVYTVTKEPPWNTRAYERTFVHANVVDEKLVPRSACLRGVERSKLVRGEVVAGDRNVEDHVEVVVER